MTKLAKEQLAALTQQATGFIELAKQMQTANKTLEEFEQELFIPVYFFIVDLEDFHGKNLDLVNEISIESLLDACFNAISEQSYINAVAQGQTDCNIFNLLNYKKISQPIALQHFSFINYLNPQNVGRKPHEFAKFYQGKIVNEAKVFLSIIENYANLVAFSNVRADIKYEINYQENFHDDFLIFSDILNKLPSDQLAQLSQAANLNLINNFLSQFPLSVLCKWLLLFKEGHQDVTVFVNYILENIKKIISQLCEEEKLQIGDNFSQLIQILLNHWDNAVADILINLAKFLAHKGENRFAFKLEYLTNALNLVDHIQDPAIFSDVVNLCWELYDNEIKMDKRYINNITRYQKLILSLSDCIKNSELSGSIREMLTKKLTDKQTQMNAWQFLRFMIFIQNPFHNPEEWKIYVENFLAMFNHSKDADLIVNAIGLVSYYLNHFEPKSLMPIKGNPGITDDQAEYFYQNTALDFDQNDFHTKLKEILTQREKLTADEVALIETYLLRLWKEKILGLFLKFARKDNGVNFYSVKDLFIKPLIELGQGIFFGDGKAAITVDLDISDSELLLIEKIRQANSFANYTQAVNAFNSTLQNSFKAKWLYKSTRKIEIEKLASEINNTNDLIVKITKSISVNPILPSSCEKKLEKPAETYDSVKLTSGHKDLLLAWNELDNAMAELAKLEKKDKKSILEEFFPYVSDDEMDDNLKQYIDPVRTILFIDLNCPVILAPIKGTDRCLYDKNTLLLYVKNQTSSRLTYPSGIEYFPEHEKSFTDDSDAKDKILKKINEIKQEIEQKTELHKKNSNGFKLFDKPLAGQDNRRQASKKAELPEPTTSFTALPMK